MGGRERRGLRLAGFVFCAVVAVAMLCADALPLGARDQVTEQVAAKPIGQADEQSVELTVGGDVSTPLKLSAADLKKLPRTTESVVNPHNKKTEVYEGVLLEELLKRAGAPNGDNLRGVAMASYVMAEASDGYRVVFSLAELDSDILDSKVMVADTMDGKPMGADLGPLRIVAPHENRPARWVRMVNSITVVQVPAPAKAAK
jgi:DMSO/TMAO reductase YedYZ molybdopterin-dependent catalytic subunit